MGKEEQNKQDSNSRMIAADNCGLQENGRQTQREMLTECGKGEEAAENGGLQESGQQEQREILTESGKDEKAAENGGLQESGQKEQRKMLTEGRKGEEAAENCSLQESGQQEQREILTESRKTANGFIKPKDKPDTAGNENQQKRYATRKVPSMKRRMEGHDYSGRGIYMITIITEKRHPVLGKLTFKGTNNEEPYIETSVVGNMVIEECLNIHGYWPQIDIQQVQPMPDHLHVLLRVIEPLPMHLGKIISFFLLRTTQRYNELCGTDIKRGENSRLWEKGYHDRIITNIEQLTAVRKYIWDNPMRLAIKRGRRELFSQIGIEVSGHFFVSIGNRELLRAKKHLQVQCSRRLTPIEIETAVERFLTDGKEGAVLVSPCISPGEKAVAHAAVEQGIPLIVLLENGFSEFYKPSGRHFNACASGKLLMLAPWEHHNERRNITREQCLQLNAMARDICCQREENL